VPRATVLGCDTDEEHLSDDGFVGRFGNARFMLNGREYRLRSEISGCLLHGGGELFTSRTLIKPECLG